MFPIAGDNFDVLEISVYINPKERQNERYTAPSSRG